MPIPTPCQLQQIQNDPNMCGKFYLHVEDFIGALIGPFDSAQSALDHDTHNKAVRGDSAAIIGIYDAGRIADTLSSLDGIGLILTSEQDRNFDAK